MLKLLETKEIEDEYGMTLCFELEELQESRYIDNEMQEHIVFVLQSDLGGQ